MPENYSLLIDYFLMKIYGKNDKYTDLPAYFSVKNIWWGVEVWARKGTILLIHTKKIIIYCCKDLLFGFSLLKYAKIDAKCVYFQLRKDGKN